MTMTKEEFKMLQALPLDVKVAKTKQRIREFVNYFGLKNVYVSFSGGKDSTVLLKIARECYPDIQAIFCDTGLEYPEIREFVKEFDNIKTVYPKITFYQVIKDYGYPLVSKDVSLKVFGYKRGLTEISRQHYKNNFYGLSNAGEEVDFRKRYMKYKPLLEAPFKISNRCCYYLKERPLTIKNKFPIIGILANESVRRNESYLKKGCNTFEKNARSTPIGFWTEQDILKYLHDTKIKFAKCYGDIIEDENGIYRTTSTQRTGCIYCLFGAHLDNKYFRLLELKKTHPNLYNYCLGGGEFTPDGVWEPTKNGLGIKFVIDWLNQNITNFNIKY